MVSAFVCGRPDVRFRKVVVLEQKWRCQILGQGVSKAVAIVQGRSMTAPLAVSPPGIEGDIDYTLRILHDNHAAVEKEGIQRKDYPVAESSKQNHPGLNQAGSADIGVVSASTRSLKRRRSGSLSMMAMSADVSTAIRPEALVRHNR